VVGVHVTQLFSFPCEFADWARRTRLHWRASSSSRRPECSRTTSTSTSPRSRRRWPARCRTPRPGGSPGWPNCSATRSVPTTSSSTRPEPQHRRSVRGTGHLGGLLVHLLQW